MDSWGSYGTDDGEFYRPVDVGIDSTGYVYVSEHTNHRVQKFTSEGIFVCKWGSCGSEPGQFYVAAGIDFDCYGNVLVVDHGNHRVQIFTNEGVFINQFGGLGTSEGLFQHPYDIAIDDVGYAYVTDHTNHRVQKFSPFIKIVAIDIKPGSEDGDDNTISLGTQGLIPIAIFTEVDIDGQIVFDATTVNPATIEIAGMGVSIQGKGNDLMAYVQDVDNDGFDDLVVHVATANFDPETIQEGEAVLTGLTFDGQAIEGWDYVTIVPTEE